LADHSDQHQPNTARLLVLLGVVGVSRIDVDQPFRFLEHRLTYKKSADSPLQAIRTHEVKFN